MGYLLMSIKNWYAWSSESEFNVWHNNVIRSLNLPQVNLNLATGLPDADAQMTLAYTEIRKVAKNDYRAIVEIEVAEQFMQGLGELSDAPPKTIEV